MARRYGVLRPHLTEFQRRLWLGAVPPNWVPVGVGRGAGDRCRRRYRASAADGPRRARTGLGTVPASRWWTGAPRPHDDALVAAFESLIDPVTRGDPKSPLRWTEIDPRADRGPAWKGHQVSDFVVRRLLGEGGTGCRPTARPSRATSTPTATPSSATSTKGAGAPGAGDPVISVDTKKKELVGSYKNVGREWRPAGDPEQVKVHDFIDTTLGKANPYGVYDSAPTPAGCRWAPITTPPRSPWTPSPWWREVGSPCTPTRRGC